MIRPLYEKSAIFFFYIFSFSFYAFQMENVRHISYIKLFTSNDTNIFYLTLQMDLTEFKNIASIAYAPTKKLAILVIYQDYMISNIKQIQKKK